MANRFHLPLAREFAANGRPMNGGKLWFYESGTSAPQDTYSDSGLTTPNTNPVVADAAGRFPDIFLGAALYKVVLTDANDVEIWSADPVGRDKDLSLHTVTPTGATTARTLAKHLADRAVTPLDFGATGDGVADDTTAVQNAINSGKTVFFPPEYSFAVTSTLTANTAGQTFCGKGKIIPRTSAMADQIVLNIEADYVTVDGIYIHNEDELKTLTTGPKQFGIFVKGSGCSVINNIVRQCVNGIGVSEAGEYGPNIVANNRVLDNLGVGGGASGVDTDGNWAEANGDGIVSWGYGTIITSNLVTCKEGQDARIGIHIEGLSSFHGATGQPTYADRAGSVTANVVLGTFRRGIVDEQVDGASITANFVAGATWWGIAVSSVWGVTVGSNTILYDRPSSNNAGSAWAVLHAGIMFYGDNQACSASDNTVVVTGDGHGLVTQSGNTGRPSNLSLTGNTFLSDGGTMDQGIYALDTDGLKVGDNTIIDAVSKSIYCFHCTDVSITGNRAQGSSTAVGLYLEGNSGSPDSAMVTGNMISDMAQGSFVGNCTSIIYCNNIHKNLTSATSGATIFFAVAEAIWNDNVYSNITTQPTASFTDGIRGANYGARISTERATTEFTDATSNLNTKIRYAGYIAVDTNEIAWVSLGSGATANWLSINDGTTTITPA